MTVTKGDTVAVFESVKAASDIYSPAGGEIVDVNSTLADDLSAITSDNAMDNWLFKALNSQLSIALSDVIALRSSARVELTSTISPPAGL